MKSLNDSVKVDTPDKSLTFTYYQGENKGNIPYSKLTISLVSSADDLDIISMIGINMLSLSDEKLDEISSLISNIKKYRKIE